MTEAPEMQAQLVSSHGMLAILEVLEAKPSREVTLKLLSIINLVSSTASNHRYADDQVLARDRRRRVPRKLLSNRVCLLGGYAVDDFC